MVYYSTVHLKKDTYKYLKKCLNSTPDEMGEVKCETVASFTGKFDNGFEADVYFQASEDDFYVDAVLYNLNGCELVTTEMCDEIEGDFVFEYEGDTFKLTVNIV